MCGTAKNSDSTEDSERNTNQGMHAVQLHVGALTRSANRGTSSMQTDSRVHIHSCNMPGADSLADSRRLWAACPDERDRWCRTAGAAVCGLCGVAVPGSNVVEKYACTIGCCVLGMFVQGHH